MNPYEILEVGKDATEAEVKKAYRKKAKIYHPDKNPGDKEAEAKYREIVGAYDILITPEKRAQYDRAGTTSAYKQNPFAGSPFETFFGGQDRGRNVQTRLEIELEEVMDDVVKQTKITQKGRCNKCEGKGYTEWQACPKCFGSGHTHINQLPFNIYMGCPACQATGRSGTVACADCVGTGFTPLEDKIIDVSIPAGVETGMQIRLPGEGEPGRNGTRNGDIFVVIVVKDHKIYKRSGPDLLIEVPVSYTQLVLGCDLELPTLQKTKVLVNIPAGTQDGTKFRVRGLGLPRIENKKKGDLLVCVRLEVPEKPENEHLSLLKKLQEIEQEQITPNRKKFHETIK